MGDVELLKSVVDETDKLVLRLSDDELGNQTPCADWNVRALLNHITGGATMFAVSAEEGHVPDEMMGQLMAGDNLGTDFKGSWGTAAERAMSAFHQPGVLEKMVKLPFGEMPAGIALRIAVFDVATHAADLAWATNQSYPSDELLETALTMGRQMIGPEMRQPGLFDAEQSVAADATAAQRLLAFAGRRV